jgi:hypothetical protein
MLTTGTVLWRLIKEGALAPERTAGTALAILGTLFVLSGMVLAWPNPASIVPTALINAAVFVSLAFILELPAAHLIAASCLALAYLVSFHVAADRCPWLNLRVMSPSCRTAQRPHSPVVVFLRCFRVAFATWQVFTAITTVATCGIVVVSLLVLMQFGLW